MSTELGKRLFTFAVVTDTHVNFGETECNSEFEINKRANGRLRHVVRDLNRQDLAFVMHLGDVVHPVPALTDLYEQAAARFQEVAAELRHPLYLAPGNHDIGDKPIVWGPGGVVREEFIELWNKNFGPNYQAFEHGDCRFYLVDAQIINSGLVHEAEQKAWLEADLAEAAGAGKRLFVGTHYPPFLTEAGEDEHFDNIAEPGRSWLLNLLERHGAEALFSGHVHNFWYNRHGVTDYYALPSTAFVRQDYAEIFRASPPPETEGGRSDLAKLGYFLVHVHAGGHLCRWVRSHGVVVEPAAPTTMEKMPSTRSIRSRTPTPVSGSTCARTGWRSSRCRRRDPWTSSTASARAMTMPSWPSWRWGCGERASRPGICSIRITVVASMTVPTRACCSRCSRSGFRTSACWTPYRRPET